MGGEQNGGTTNGSHGASSNIDDTSRRHRRPTWKVATLVVLAIGGVLLLSLFVFSDVFQKSSSSASSVSSAQEKRNRDETSGTHAPTTSSTDPSQNTPQPNSSPLESSTPPTTDILRTKRGTYRLIDQWPHDPAAFCQGLEVKNETHLYESIGLYGDSAMRIVETRTGDVTLENTMPATFFGEGVSLIMSDGDDKDPYLLQLTWKEKTAFLYHPETLQELSRFPYETTNTQGWGIAYDMHRHVAYVTDGTEFVHTWKLIRADDGTFGYQEIAKVSVTVQFADGHSDTPQTLRRINELEYDPATRTLLANVWFENVLIRIDVDSGFVTHVYDLTSIYTNRDPSADVLNGIAVIPNEPGRLYVTGKLWPTLYYIELVDL
eukprot:scaffold5296_cov163-Amphora_coffeaeformis.AAC.3